ncbi:MAG: ABC transporter permease, partial [Thermodesulfobacteriota bacterium]
IGLWEVLVPVLEIPRFVLPTPSQILGEIFNVPATLARHSLVTLYEILLGFLIGVGVGVGLAISIVYSKVLEETIYPLVIFTQVIPKIAIAPLLIIWLGYGAPPKIVIVFLICFFPMVIDTAAGLKSVEEDMLHLIRALGATPWQIFTKIRLPNAMPYIFNGMKISVTLAVVGAIVGEFVGASEGLGYLILVGSANLETNLLFAAVIVLSLLGIVLFSLVRVLEKICIPWKPPEE